jgi:hypothetical protein
MFKHRYKIALDEGYTEVEISVLFSIGLRIYKLP